MFDEYLNPPPCVDLQVPIVIAPEPAISTGTPSSTTIDQDAPSLSTSQTTPKTPSPIIPLSVEEADHDIEVAHMDNNPYVDFLIPEPSFEESSTQVVIPNNAYKEALTKSSWIEAMQEGLNDFERLEVWELVPHPDRISQSPRGIFLNQSKYALKPLKKYGIETCEPSDTPMVEKSKLDEDSQGKAVVCMCARYQAKPTEKHLHAVKRIFRYLRGTINMGLWYSKDSCIALTAFADANHAGCQDTRKSTSGSMQHSEKIGEPGRQRNRRASPYPVQKLNTLPCQDGLLKYLGCDHN
ncbi:hypothetical protein Tco_1355312 [Tanacetum coccineum]